MLWDTFRNAMFCLAHKRQLLPSNLADRVQQTLEICHYTLTLSKSETLLYSTRYTQYSDERDRVYAILNLSHDFKLEPNYSKPTKDVFKSVFLGYASTTKSLTMLRYCEMGEYEIRRHMPTWVPDWTTPNECSRLNGTRACLGTNAQTRCDGDKVLVVSGRFVATLDSITKIMSPPGFGTAQTDQIIRELMRGKTKNDSYIAGGFMIDALCRTLCGGSFAEIWLPLEPDYPKFDDSKEFVRNIMDRQESVEPRGYVEQVSEMMGRRAFFLTKNGYIGLGPESIKSGD